MNKKGYINSIEFQKYIKDGYFTVEKHEEEDLYIYGYSTGPLASKNLKWNSVTRQMRGLITNKEGKIIARSFQKFFTYRNYLSPHKVLLSDGQIAQVPPPSIDYKVYEKLDGTLGLLYWIDDVPYIASQRSFKSFKAKKATEILHQKYSNTFDKLKKDRTYIFEVISKESKVLIDYGNEDALILIGVLDIETGRDYPLEDIGFPIAKNWTEDLSNIKNYEEFQKLNLENKEGLVIVYENGFRIKVKFPWYKEAHLLVNKIIQYEYYIDSIEDKLKELLNFPENVPSTSMIWERFSKGQSVSQIMDNFPHKYKFLGIKKILQNEFKKFEIKSKKQNNLNVLPDEDVLFNLKEKLNKPLSENIMLNRWNNLEDKFN